ncbi:pseudouridine synthase [Corynebacterium frankenforstense]
MPEGPAVTAFELVSAAVRAQRHRHPADDETAVRARFARGEVVLGSAAPLAAGDELTAGTDVWFYRMPAPEKHVPGELTVIYADEDITLVNKPPFMATMPRGAHVTETLVVRLRRATGNEEITPAHRLDRATSGLVLCTNRREIRGAYQGLFESGQVAKTYEAVARFDAGISERVDAGAPAEREGPGGGVVWSSRIEKTRGVLQAREVAGEINAVTELDTVVPFTGDAAIIDRSCHSDVSGTPSWGVYRLHPRTGKTHQLRVHMNSAGVPICNDPLYPDIRPDGWGEFDHPLMLRSVELSFTDPLSGEPRSVRTAGWNCHSPFSRRPRCL